MCMEVRLQTAARKSIAPLLQSNFGLQTLQEMGQIWFIVCSGFIWLT